MNYRLERIRSRPGRLREMGDQLTGGGVRALLQRLFMRMRITGDRLTGGGLRSLSKRMAATSLRTAMSQPFLKALGRSVLKPFPSFSALVYRLAAAPYAVTTSADTAATPSTILPQRRDPAPLVNSLYKTAFGRIADPEGLATCSHQLELGVSLEELAEQIVTSVEFLTRHGPNRGVDMKYLTSLYRDGLGRQPNLENLAFWLAEADNHVTRAKVCAAVAGSDEALEKLRVIAPDSEAIYHRWVANNDTIGDVDRTMIRTHIAGLPYCPLISVILPLERTVAFAFSKSLNSVTTQLYPYWELCITTNEATEPTLSRGLGISEDPRIKVIELNDAGGATAATNAALSSATAEFVTVLRSGDILPEHALYEVALELGRNERTDIVYTDNDQPGWDPDLLLAQDYISHLAVYRRTLVEAIGLLRPDFDGAEFHDLALRATAATTPDRVRHIPAILYHRFDGNRAIHSENALLSLRAITATRRAVRDHLDSRREKEAILKTAPLMASAIRITWPIPTPEPLVSVIVPTRDRADLLAQCVEGILHRTDYSNLELLIVDNGSVEPATLTLFDQLTSSDNRVSILAHPGPFNYSAMNNAAARAASGEVLLLLNNDIDVVDSVWLRELVSHAIRPDVGVVGAKLLYANEQIQHGGIALGPNGQIIHVHRLANRTDPGYCGQLALARTLSAVTGACAAIRRAVFFEVGGLDEVNLTMAFNDIDLCLRVGDYGYRVVWTPFAELFHLESASRGLDDANPAKRERFLRELQYMQKTWGSLLESADPFHNPNLLFAWEHFEVPSEPRREKPWRSVFEEVLNLKGHFSLSQDSAW
jgi:GT2 family glycosyltransferase